MRELLGSAAATHDTAGALPTQQPGQGYQNQAWAFAKAEAASSAALLSVFERVAQSSLAQSRLSSDSAVEPILRVQRTAAVAVVGEEGMQLDSVKRKRAKKMKKHKWKKRSKVLRRQTKASRGAKK